MSEQLKTCRACQSDGLPVRDCLGYCDRCGACVDSIDYLHAVGGQDLCDVCAKAAGHQRRLNETVFGDGDGSFYEHGPRARTQEKGADTAQK